MSQAWVSSESSTNSHPTQNKRKNHHYESRPAPGGVQAKKLYQAVMAYKKLYFWIFRPPFNGTTNGGFARAVELMFS